MMDNRNATAVLVLFGILCNIFMQSTSVTMKQFESTLEVLRSACMPKFNIPPEKLDDLRKGIFDEKPDLKCYTKCVAQMAGTLTKKGEVSYQKALAQINTIIPAELQEVARQALEACKNVQNDYKDSCDKTFYSTKCVYEYSPENFRFP